MKKIRINLELYFESYEFLIFRDFSGIFRIYFRFKSIKNNEKNDKKGVSFRAGPTWVRRGMQGHVAEPRGLA